jgi:hypothetical protein
MTIGRAFPLASQDFGAASGIRRVHLAAAPPGGGGPQQAADRPRVLLARSARPASSAAAAFACGNLVLRPGSHRLTVVPALRGASRLVGLCQRLVSQLVVVIAHFAGLRFLQILCCRAGVRGRSLSGRAADLLAVGVCVSALFAAKEILLLAHLLAPKNVSEVGKRRADTVFTPEGDLVNGLGSR